MVHQHNIVELIKLIKISNMQDWIKCIDTLQTKAGNIMCLLDKGNIPYRPSEFEQFTFLIIFYLLGIATGWMLTDMYNRYYN